MASAWGGLDDGVSIKGVGRTILGERAQGRAQKDATWCCEFVSACCWSHAFRRSATGASLGPLHLVHLHTAPPSVNPHLTSPSHSFVICWMFDLGRSEWESVFVMDVDRVPGESGSSRV
ncbi:hypothetical protein Hypma_002004 [Hypsizygus marmoreus]|uniref:Uncharacterized protein n=1 Tax=Hypsizygus marmoreus TaxID=39966 RepID=A0A369J729_HYPMA|nr:hypothetical protein Hypma_002004 [Hypsizygus marmoreus]